MHEREYCQVQEYESNYAVCLWGMIMSKRVPLKEAVRLEIISKCNNRCCICQTPFVQIHHIDGDRSNNDFDNLAPLCPNCHDQAGLKRPLSNRLTLERIKKLRDMWYAYCEKRKEGINVSANAKLKMKNFQRSVGWPVDGWAKTFSSINPSYAKFTVNDIIDRVFSTSNPDDLLTYLETVKHMYRNVLIDEKNFKKFKNLCNSFGINYDDLS